MKVKSLSLTFHFHALEKEMATHSSVLAWRIPGTVEPVGLPSMGSHRVRHDWSDLAAASHYNCNQFSSVQSLSRVRLFATPWITARQGSLSIMNSRSPLKLMSIELVMPSSHVILCLPFSSCPQPLPASGSFPVSQLFAWGGQNIGVSASATVPPVNTQDWSPLGWTGWNRA